MKEIVIATSNPGKLEEFKEMLKDMEVELHYLAEWPGIEAPEENGRTFAANARLKATYYAKATGMTCIADDSGLEVQALDGEMNKIDKTSVVFAPHGTDISDFAPGDDEEEAAEDAEEGDAEYGEDAYEESDDGEDADLPDDEADETDEDDDGDYEEDYEEDDEA
mgnify:FL=1